MIFLLTEKQLFDKISWIWMFIKGWNNFKTPKFLILSVAYCYPPYLHKFWWTAQTLENKPKVWGVFCTQCISDCHFCVRTHTQRQTQRKANLFFTKSFFSTAVLLFSISIQKHLLLQLKIFYFNKKKYLDLLRFFNDPVCFLIMRENTWKLWDVT